MRVGQLEEASYLHHVPTHAQRTVLVQLVAQNITTKYLTSAGVLRRPKAVFSGGEESIKPVELQVFLFNLNQLEIYQSFDTDTRVQICFYSKLYWYCT